MSKYQEEHQQQLIGILEKVSDQEKKVENIQSGSVPILEGEYYTPPVSQTRITTPSTLSAPRYLPIFSRQMSVPITEGLIDK